MSATTSTSLTLGERQLAIYLAERGVAAESIPPAARKEIIEMALETMELVSLRNSQAMVMYLSMLKAYSQVVADYCTKVGQNYSVSEQAICDVLSSHGVLAAS